MNQQIRAVAVCRCSTEEERQKEALTQQVKEATQCIQEMGWFLTDAYVEAKSGTTVKGRKEYNRLLADMQTDKFDVIVIKSIDRLMRNTKDWYLFLDRLQQNQKRLYMYLERKFYTPDDSLLTGMKAILAEEYSRELSKKITNAHRHRQKEGNHFVITNATYGYKNVNKETVINTEDVPLIKRVFELAAQGYGSYIIANMLYNEGYRNRKREMIAGHVVCRMIRNPIYTGDIVLNKKHYDFERKCYIDNPQSEWIVRKGAVEPIISRELFELANAAVDARAVANGKKNTSLSSYTRYPLSGKLVCGLCGKTYNRCTRKSAQKVEWKCSTFLQRGRRNKYKEEGRRRVVLCADGCDNIHLDEAKLYEALEQFGAQWYRDLDKNRIVQMVLELMCETIDTDEYIAKEATLKKEIDKLKHHKNILLDKLLNEVITDNDYKEKSSTIQSQIDFYEMEQKKLADTKSAANNVKSRMNHLESLLRSSVIKKAQVNDLLAHIEDIVVYPEELQIHMKPIAFVDLDVTAAANRKESLVISSSNVRTNPRSQIEKDKCIIIEMMTKTPKITAKQIAQQNNWALSRVNRRIAELKQLGKIQYSTPNGKGYWIINK